MSSSNQSNTLSVEGIREFVYLDSTSVSSLLASQYMADPETVEQAFKKGSEDQSKNRVRGGLHLPNLLRVGGSRQISTSEKEIEQSRTTNRINDQYRFTVLRDTLNKKEDVKIHDLTDEDSDGTKIDLSPGELIQIQGDCSTDPLYRLFGAVTLLEDDSYTKLESISEVKLGEQRKKLYNGMVGLKIEAGGCQFGMVVQEEDLWIDARREFLGPQEYTVLGRVEDEIDSRSDRYWDLIDALRILGEIVPPKELEKQRDELIDEVVKNVDLEIDIEEQLIESALLERLYSENVSSSDLGEERKKLASALKTVQEGENADEGTFYTLHRILYPFNRVNDEEQGESTELNLEQHIDKDEMTNEMTIDSGYVISPIAIYW